MNETHHLSRLKRPEKLACLTDTEEEYVPNFCCSDAANGNGPLHLPGDVDVCIKPGTQFQSGGRPLRRLLEPDQHKVSSW